MLGYGVGAPVRFKHNEETPGDRGPGLANQSDQQAKQGNADQTEPTRHPSHGSWNVMPAVGREKLYLSVFDCAGSWVGALCLLLGSRVGARG